MKLTGEINSKGELLVHGKSRLIDFTKRNPNNRLIIHIELLAKPPSEAMIAYYEKVILPELQRGFIQKGNHLTLEKIDIMLRGSFSPTTLETFENGKYQKSVPEIRKLSQENMLYYLDFVRLYAAMNLQIYLQEPRLL